MGYFKKNGFLPFSEPYIGEEELEAVKRVFERNWFTTGPEVKEFEKEFAAYTNSKIAVAVNSATAALHISLASLEVGNKDDIIAPPFTFVSTINTIVETGAYPVLIDIDTDDYGISPDKIEDEISENYIKKGDSLFHKKRGNRLKGIIVVHYGGQPAKIDKLNDIAKKYNIKIIEDAAHAIGSKSNGKKIGNSDNLVCFSFYSNKNMTTGEGGMVTTNNSKIEKTLRMYSLHGIDKQAYSRLKQEGLPYYDVKVLGFKYNMMDISAAIGREQLKKIDMINKKRDMLAQLYEKYFSEIEEIKITPLKKKIYSSRHLFTISLNNKINRDSFIKKLLEKKIQTSIHFIPVYHFNYYKNHFPYKKNTFKNTEAVFNSIVSLPIFPSMEEEDIKTVIYYIKEILSKL